MEAKRWCIPIARTGLSIKRSKELPLLARLGHGVMSDLCPLSGEERESIFGAVRSVDGPIPDVRTLGYNCLDLVSQDDPSPSGVGSLHHV